MRKLAVVAALTVVAALVVTATPAQAGDGNQAGARKVVVGPGPDGPYSFQLDCGGALSNFTLNNGESDGGFVPGLSCTITETDDLGADSVSYTCEVISGPATCVGQTATFPAGAAPSIVEWTVTNTFNEPTTTTTAPTTTTTAPTSTTAAPRAVAVTPAFTG